VTPETVGPAPRGRATDAIHAGAPAPRPHAPVVTPIYLSSTFFTDSPPGGEIRYTRYGNNPNHEVLGARLAALEGADAALVVASGNAAMALALLSVAARGGSIVAQRELYGGTLRLLRRELPGLGIQTRFVPFDGDWAAATIGDVAALLLEVPVNPTLRVPDLDAVAALARDRGAPLIVDATFASPVNLRALEHGAALVIHSATKYLGGHSDITAGVIAGENALVAEAREKLISFGPVLDPHAAWLLERGLKTLPARMARHNANGGEIARWLQRHPRVLSVHYPGLEQHPDHARAARLLDGFGGMVGMVVRGGDEAARAALSALRLIRVAPSLGGVESLASMPRDTSHAALAAEERQALGIGDGFVRLSLGIEDAADLIADLEVALAG
jgi:cystathionine beta-lyase/cystathionine gamma-synthase